MNEQYERDMDQLTVIMQEQRTISDELCAEVERWKKMGGWHPADVAEEDVRQYRERGTILRRNLGDEVYERDRAAAEVRWARWSEFFERVKGLAPGGQFAAGDGEGDGEAVPRRTFVAGHSEWFAPPAGPTDTQVAAALEVLHARRHEGLSEDLARAVLEAALGA